MRVLQKWAEKTDVLQMVEDTYDSDYKTIPSLLTDDLSEESDGFDSDDENSYYSKEEETDEESESDKEYDSDAVSDSDSDSDAVSDSDEESASVEEDDSDKGSDSDSN